MTRCAVIVDGCSTGALLAPAFAERGIVCVHLQSTGRPPKILAGAAAYNPGDYVACLMHCGSIEATVAALTPYRPICVVPGTELGVELADLLNDRMQLPGNAIELSAARRDKYQMVNAVQRAGLSTIPTFASDNVGRAVEWANNASYPVVVKPARSGGTDGVTLCHNESELRAAYGVLLNRENILNEVNDFLVSQTYIRGTEYIVDLVSSEGRHKVTDIWRYSKREGSNGASFIYDHAWLLPYRGTVQEKLVAYAKALLDALGIRYGASHCEIMVTDAGVPVMVEVGARICGGFVAKFCSAALDTDQVSLLAESYINPDTVVKFDELGYVMRKRALRVLLISPRRGRLLSLPYIDEVRQLPSYYSDVIVEPGAEVHPTSNFYSHPGRIDLLHDNEAVLRKDMETIRKLEAERFYVFE